MSENMRNAISELQRHLEDLEQQSIDTKKTINSLCRVMGEPLLYADTELTAGDLAGRAFQLNGDEYFNRPLAAVVRSILEGRRDRSLGPATAEEIYEQMSAGGFEFEGRSEDKALHGLKISLSKNTTAFMKLPNGKFGLAEWYGRRDQKPRLNGSNRQSEPDEAEEAEELELGDDAGGALVVTPVSPSKPR